MTEAWRLGVPVEKAAIALASNVRTMMTHYVALDETEVTDEVLTLIAKEVGPDGRGTKHDVPLSDSSRAARPRKKDSSD